MKRILTLAAFLFAVILSSLNFSDLDFLYGPGFGARVIAVADGDTFTVRHGRRKERIRLYGIDCPEKLQEFGLQARLLTARLTTDQPISVIPVARDRYGRTLAYVILADGTNLNYELVAKGCAWWYRQYAKQDVQFATRELYARARRRGLWSSDDPIAPWDFRKGVSISSSSAQKDALF
jgi:endonuclease YncB( thermonuclease family)